MKSFETEIITPDRKVFSGQVDGLLLKGARGYFGILAGHAPLIARLAPGNLELTVGGKKKVCAAGAGFVHVANRRVSIILESFNET